MKKKKKTETRREKKVKQKIVHLVSRFFACFAFTSFSFVPRITKLLYTRTHERNKDRKQAKMKKKEWKKNWRKIKNCLINRTVSVSCSIRRCRSLVACRPRAWTTQDIVSISSVSFIRLWFIFTQRVSFSSSFSFSIFFFFHFVSPSPSLSTTISLGLLSSFLH